MIYHQFKKNAKKKKKKKKNVASETQARPTTLWVWSAVNALKPVSNISKPVSNVLKPVFNALKLIFGFKTKT